jgi:anti-sigma-K factor RskA
MITERQEELAALHAVGLLEGVERSAFELEVAADPELRAFTVSLQETTARLALTVPQVGPPAELKGRILAACAESVRPAPAPATVTAFPLRRLFPWAIAASLALTTAWLGTRYVAVQRENATLRTERELAELAYKMAQNKLTERSLVAEQMINSLGQKLHHAEDLARLKVSALASLAGNTRQAQVIAVWDPDQQSGLLTMEKLPATTEAQDYQIWIVDPAYANPVNGGVFHVAADGRVALPFRPDQPVKKATAFAISLEKKGGVPKAEGPIVLLGKP